MDKYLSGIRSLSSSVSVDVCAQSCLAFSFYYGVGLDDYSSLLSVVDGVCFFRSCSLFLFFGFGLAWKCPKVISGRLWCSVSFVSLFLFFVDLRLCLVLGWRMFFFDACVSGSAVCGMEVGVDCKLFCCGGTEGRFWVPYWAMGSLMCIILAGGTNYTSSFNCYKHF